MSTHTYRVPSPSQLTELYEADDRLPAYENDPSQSQNQGLLEAYEDARPAPPSYAQRYITANGVTFPVGSSRGTYPVQESDTCKLTYLYMTPQIPTSRDLIRARNTPRLEVVTHWGNSHSSSNAIGNDNLNEQQTNFFEAMQYCLVDKTNKWRNFVRKETRPGDLLDADFDEDIRLDITNYLETAASTIYATIAGDCQGLIVSQDVLDTMNRIQEEMNVRGYKGCLCYSTDLIGGPGVPSGNNRGRGRSSSNAFSRWVPTTGNGNTSRSTNPDSPKMRFAYNFPTFPEDVTAADTLSTVRSSLTTIANRLNEMVNSRHIRGSDISGPIQGYAQIYDLTTCAVDQGVLDQLKSCEAFIPSGNADQTSLFSSRRITW